MKTKTRIRKLPVAMILTAVLTLVAGVAMLGILGTPKSSSTVQAAHSGTSIDISVLANGDFGTAWSNAVTIESTYTVNTITVTDNVTIIGTTTNANTQYRINIPDGKKVTWAATYSGSVGNLVLVTGKGTFEVAAGGSIRSSSSMGQVLMGGTNSADTVTIIISGTVETVAASNYCLNSRNGDLIISGGTVNAKGGASYNGTAIGAYNNITVLSGTVSATTTGSAISGNASVTVEGGTISAMSGVAIYSSSTVTVTGGSIKNDSPSTNVINATIHTTNSAANAVKISGCSVENEGTGAAISATTGRVSISGSTTITAAAGIAIDAGSFSMTGGTVTIGNNSKTNPAIKVSNTGSSLSISGGTLTVNGNISSTGVGISALDGGKAYVGGTITAGSDKVNIQNTAVANPTTPNKTLSAPYDGCNWDEYTDGTSYVYIKVPKTYSEVFIVDATHADYGKDGYYTWAEIATAVADLNAGGIINLTNVASPSTDTTISLGSKTVKIIGDSSTAYDNLKIETSTSLTIENLKIHRTGTGTAIYSNGSCTLTVIGTCELVVSGTGGSGNGFQVNNNMTISGTGSLYAKGAVGLSAYISINIYNTGGVIAESSLANRAGISFNYMYDSTITVNTSLTVYGSRADNNAITTPTGYTLTLRVAATGKINIINNSSTADEYNFSRVTTDGLYWQTVGATYVGEPTDANVTVTVAAGATGTIKRVNPAVVTINLSDTSWFGTSDITDETYNWSYVASTNKITVTDDVTVIGSVMGAPLNIDIAAGKTLTWTADYSGINFDNLIMLTNTGKFQMTGGSIIQNGNGRAISSNTNNVTISGGTVTSKTGTAISAASVTVNNGSAVTVSNDSEINPAIYIGSGSGWLDVNDGTLTVNGDIVSENGGIYAVNGSVVTVNGSIDANNNGVIAEDGTKVYITGTVDVAPDENFIVIQGTPTSANTNKILPAPHDGYYWDEYTDGTSYVYLRQGEIVECEHIWVEANCTTPETCSECGETEGEVNDHTSNNAKDADCTLDSVCTDCGVVTEAKNASHTSNNAKDDDCTVNSVCAVCGVITEVKNASHTSNNAKAADCTVDSICTVCGVITDAKNESHNYEWAEKTPVTDDQDGEEIEICSVCGNEGDTRTVPKHTHEYGAWQVTTPATCLAAGEEKQHCTFDGCAAFQAQLIDINPNTHALSKTNSVAATCLAAGNPDYWTCSHCGKYFANATGTTELTAGQIVIAALGHNWGSWNQTTAPTYVAAGVETRTCSRCSHFETRGVPKLVHTITGGKDGKWSGIGGFQITISGNITDFNKLIFNTVELTKDTHYTITAGSVIVTIKAEYLETLDAGDHNIEIVFTHGSATTKLTITATGDTTPTVCTVCEKEQCTCDTTPTVCSVCGNDPCTCKDGGLGTGAIVGIVIGVLVLLGGGFALYWFVIRPRN